MKLWILLIGALTQAHMPADGLPCMCTCASTDKAKRPAEREVIFIGDALEVDQVDAQIGQQRIRFVVQASWRGNLGDTVTLLVGRNAPCAWYVAGARYLVAADSRRTATAPLTTGICDVALALGYPWVREIVAELGAPTTAPGGFQRSILATAVGEKPTPTPDTARVSLGGLASDTVASIEIADQIWMPRGYPLPTFRLPVGMYQLRLHWSDGSISETYLSVRCEERDSSNHCQSFRFLKYSRINIRPAG